jgi:hypothetical protein
MWDSAIHFPCCPTNIGTDPLDDYVHNTSTGDVLAYSDDPDICPKLIVERVNRLGGREALVILCKRAGTGWTIVGIEVRGRLPHFIHFYLGSYSSEVEADEAFKEKATADFWSDAYANAYRNR